jgi:hypothetical protein
MDHGGGSSAFRKPFAKALSMRLRSERSMPAWWMPIPAGNSSCNSLCSACLAHLRSTCKNVAGMRC